MRIAVDATAKTYSLTVNAGAYRAPATQFAWSENLGMKIDYVDKYSDGSTKPAYAEERTSSSMQFETAPDGNPRFSANLYLAGAGSSATGGRHVSLGNWVFAEFARNADGSLTQTGWNAGYFAFGNRTAPVDIPVSGTARYDIENDLGEGTSCDWGGCVSMFGNTGLNVDFAARRIAAAFATSLSYDFHEGPAGSPTRVRAGSYEVRTNASGSSLIGNSGDFDIALSGTSTRLTERVDKALVDPLSIPVSGRIAGAFYGPQAGEIGGVYSLPAPNLIANDANGANVDLVVDQYDGAFTAVRAAP